MGENRQTYHIIGAGIAGLAAAEFIKKKNPQIRTIVYEASAKLGGRCYSSFDEDLNCRLDNATHVILGGNRRMANMLQPRNWNQTCWFWNAETGELSKNYRHFSAHILKSMCNTDPQELPPETVKTILWKLFPWLPAQRKIYFSQQDLSQYLINPRLAYVDELKFNHKMTKIDSQFGRAVVLHFGSKQIDLGPEDKVILALDSRGYHALLGGESFDYNGIINIVYRTSQTLKLPHNSSFLGIVNGLADWVFISNNLVSVTISAVRAEGQQLDQLARDIWLELDKIRGVNSGFIPSFKVFNHKVATISQDRENNAKRPVDANSIFPNVFIAGDWTMKDYPCCLETAVLSAERAVKTALASH